MATKLTTDRASTSFPEQIVNAIMSSPLYFPIVKTARQTMVKTATSVGIPWESIAANMLSKCDWEAEARKIAEESSTVEFPSYFVSKFHGYEDGNLCVSAAVEQEIAGKAVGARNFPAEGIRGEAVLRDCYRTQMHALGVSVRDGASIVDMGCGTGTSTRRLAEMFPGASNIVGIDLSPYMIAVGRYLQNNFPDDSEWVENIKPDKRISFQRLDMASTGLPEGSVSLVSLCLVLHELPIAATKEVFTEAYRLLEPGGCLSIMEMDPQAPGYRKLRSNPWLFSILRSTEPWLDEYFSIPSLPAILRETGFSVCRVSAATGRHLAIVAVKEGSVDLRPSDVQRESDDQHVSTLIKDISKR